METEYIVGDINLELEEIEHMNEADQETNNIYRYTNTGPVLSLLCC